MSGAPVQKTTKSTFIVHIQKSANCTKKEAEFIYNTFMSTLIDEIMSGHEVILINFGYFALKPHKGHKIRFSDKANSIDDYITLKFAVSHSFIKRLREKQPVCAN